MLKRMVSLVLVFVLLLSAIPVANALIIVIGHEEPYGDDLKYKIDASDTMVLSIYGNGAMMDRNDSMWDGHGIKSAIIEEGVTRIGNYSFANCDKLTSVTISSSVTSIGDYAFDDCGELVSVTIAEGVTSIGDYAFQNCDKLVSVTLPSTISSIGRRAFYGCDALTTVTIADSLTEVSAPDDAIGIYIEAFSGCNSLRSVTIGGQVTTVGAYAFRNNTGLMSVEIGDSVTSIQDRAFEGCSKLTTVTIGDSVTDIGYRAFQACTDLKSLILGQNVSHIEDYAFAGCSSLEAVVFPEHVTSMGEGAFFNCSALSSITLSSGVESIGVGAFQSTGLREVFYYGTSAQWGSMTIGSSQTPLTSATRHYMSVSYVGNGQGAHIQKDICSHCDLVIESPETSCVDENMDTVCDICGGLVKFITKFDIYGSNMTLGNELKVNFFFPRSAVTDIDSIAVITQTQADGDDRIVEIPQSDWLINGIYYKIPVDVTAKEMADALTLEVKDADGYILNDDYVTSVRDYAGKALTSETASGAVKTMVVDMLNYGASAQMEFGYNEDDLANGLLTEEQQALATEEVDSTNTLVGGKYVYGSNLSLEERILMNVHFKGLKNKDVSSMYAIVSFTSYTGDRNEIVVKDDGFVEYGTTGDIYKIIVDDIVLADARQDVTVTVYDADGSVYAECTDSVESYVARAIMNMVDGNGLYTNILKFADSAKNYFLNR
ncbi:MAG: leucine-rich repeat domain-containing protein [Oscillospiraceae bacterium]|nr:leucine-rich repeat domain-containing protein [Oscillospiraceae bacterium]